MASIRQRGKKKTWYALFRDAAGKLVERSCKTADKKKAQGMADEWEILARPTATAATADQMRKVISELHLRYLGTEAPKMSVRDYFDRWYLQRAAEVGPDSQGFYRRTLDLFLTHLGPRADEDFFRVQRVDVAAFRDAELSKNTAATTNHKLKMLRMVFRAATEDGWIPQNPMVGLKAAKKIESSEVIREDRRGYTVEELKLVLDACPTTEWKDIVVRTYYTGQRLKDIALMTQAQEDVHTASVWFQTSKTNKRVILSMHPAYLDYVLAKECGDDPKAPLHPEAFECVMKRVRAGKKAATVTLSGQFQRILARAGLREKDTHRKKGKGRSAARRSNALVFHSTRHSFVSHLADAGVSKSVVMDMVGHSSAQVNTSYTHIEASTKRDAIAKMPNITQK